MDDHRARAPRHRLSKKVVPVEPVALERHEQVAFVHGAGIGANSAQLAILARTAAQRE